VWEEENLQSYWIIRLSSIASETYQGLTSALAELADRENCKKMLAFCPVLYKDTACL
jgi:hypothetical protein